MTHTPIPEPELGQEYDTHRVILRSNPHRDTQAFQRILHGLLPEWVHHFRGKNQDYSGAGAEPHKVLGVQGQFADIWRKIWKLKKALWDGQTLTGEQPEEILRDLIGHCFLTLDLLREAKVERLEEALDALPDQMPPQPKGDWDGPTCGAECKHPRTEAGPLACQVLAPAPANEEEAYTAQRTARFQRQQADAKDARRWRVRHCGPECAEGHTYRDRCQNAGME